MEKMHTSLLVLIIFYLVGCAPTPQTPEVVVENTLTPTAVPTEVSATPRAAAYENLSPSKIRMPDINLIMEISGRLTLSNLSIDTNVTVPEAFMSTLPLGNETPIFTDTKIVHMSMPLNLQMVGGGGGGGIENGILSTGGGQSYQVNSPLTIGQKVRFEVMVVFSEYVKNGMQILFTLDLIVEPDLPAGG